MTEPKRRHKAPEGECRTCDSERAAEPDYRDGKWHHWDGRDECPVDENDEVNFQLLGEELIQHSPLAGPLDWTTINGFRVTKKAEPEPDESWAHYRPGSHVPTNHASLESARKSKAAYGGTIYHCKEVK